MDFYDLDVEFDQEMADIKHNISFLENELDMMAISCWITRLSQPACNIEDKIRRNEYIIYLSYMLKREMIHQPFVNGPPDGPLPPLNFDMVTTSCKDDCLFPGSIVGSPAAGSSGYSYESAKSLKTPARCMSSLEGTRLSDLSPSRMRGPMAITTPCQANRLSIDPMKHTPPTQTKTAMLTKMTPCTPCARHNKGLIEKPGGKLRDKKEVTLSPSPERVLPDFSSPGYLDYTSEVDYKPFLPPLPGTEQANLHMMNILESAGNCNGLYDFIRNIGPTTCDQGQLLNYTATAEISQFQEFVQSMYKTRMHDIEELLGKEQMKLKERYEDWEAAVIRRSQTALRGLKRLIPEFRYDSYKKESDYIYSMLRAQYSIEEDELHPQIRRLRIKEQKKRWLTDESERIEKENEDRLVELKNLNDHLNILSKSYNSEHKDFLNRNRCLEEKAAQLRIRFHNNQKMIDTLIDELNTQPCN